MAEEKETAKKKVRRPTAQKRDLQNEKRRLNNRVFTSRVNSAIRSFENSLQKGDATSVKDSLKNVFSLMDKGVKTGLFKLNKASRTKARLTQRVQAKA